MTAAPAAESPLGEDPCPRCKADLNGAPRPDGGFYSRKIGVEVLGAWDGVLFWRCPDCEGEWHRFPEGHGLRAIAERHIAKDSGGTFGGTLPESNVEDRIRDGSNGDVDPL